MYQGYVPPPQPPPVYTVPPPQPVVQPVYQVTPVVVHHDPYLEQIKIIEIKLYA